MSSLLGYTEVLLGDGTRLRGVLPTVRELARLGLLNERLSRVAMSMGDPALLKAELEEPDHAEAAEEYLRRLASAFPRQRWDPETGAWLPHRMTPDEVDAIGDAVVRDQLDDLVLRNRSAAEVSSWSRFVLGMDDEQEGEVATGVDGWAGFRGDQGGPPAGADSEPVVAAPVGDARRGRRGGGHRARRGAGHPGRAGRGGSGPGGRAQPGPAGR